SLLSKFIAQGKLKMARTPVQCNFTYPFTLAQRNESNEGTKHRLNEVIDVVMRLCKRVVDTCDNVLREVGDEPKYLDVRAGFLEDYKARFGVSALTPISSVLAPIKNVHTLDDEVSLTPFHVN